MKCTLFQKKKTMQAKRVVKTKPEQIFVIKSLNKPTNLETYNQVINGRIEQGLKSIGSMGALLPGRVSLARKVDKI